MTPVVAGVRYDVLTRLPGPVEVVHEGGRVLVTGTGDLVPAVLEALARTGVEARQVQVHSASLEDAFVRLTHHATPAPVPMEVGRR